MAIQDRLTSEELQTYYDTAEGISLMPGWVEGEGQRPPEIEPFLWRWSQVEPLVLKERRHRCSRARRTASHHAPHHSWTGSRLHTDSAYRDSTGYCPVRQPRRTATRPLLSAGYLRVWAPTPQ